MHADSLDVASQTSQPQPLPPESILNVAAYKFVQLEGVEELRSQLLQLCKSLGLRGTILLSAEGINLFLAGPPPAVQSLLAHLRADPALSDLETKESYSDHQPFRRMLVRLKKEIIAFGIDSVCPQERTSPKLSATELKLWLDEGRPLRLLDVRNEYEIGLGTFAGAEHLRIGHFREFPQAIAKLPEEAKGEPIVMFCTGGIRCEKAGPLMEQAGFEQVYQLDGGILKYFEECGGEHYDGACFVFDGRVALDPALQPTGNLLCFACQAVLSPEDVESDQFEFGQWCPHCYQPAQTRLLQQLANRQAVVRQLAEAQPGTQAYENIRKLYVPRRLAGSTLIDFLQAWHPPTAREQWEAYLAAGQITVDGRPATAELRVKEGQCFEQREPGTVEPRINPAIELLYEDDLLVVVNKPAPLPVHPSGRFSRNTLTSILAEAYPRQKLRAAHRLDANTSGVLVLCRTYQAARKVQPQFSNGAVTKRYIARVHGHPAWTRYVCEARVDSEPQPGGKRGVNESHGLPARTELELLRCDPDGTALLAVTPITGRTHQIRIHLWHLGHAIVGDPLYLPQHAYGQTHTLALGDPPLCLHAAEIGFQHPESDEPIVFNAPRPPWAE